MVQLGRGAGSRCCCDRTGQCSPPARIERDRVAFAIRLARPARPTRRVWLRRRKYPHLKYDAAGRRQERADATDAPPRRLGPRAGGKRVQPSESRTNEAQK